MRSLEHIHRLAEGLLSCTTDPALLVGPSGMIHAANAAASLLLKRDERDVVGARLSHLVEMTTSSLTEVWERQWATFDGTVDLPEGRRALVARCAAVDDDVALVILWPAR